MIPEKAIGAATESVIASLRAMELGWVDTDMPDGVTIDVRDFDLTAAISEALEAAAPYMLGPLIADLDKWAGRSKSGFYDEAQDDVVQILNPYRSGT